MYQSIIQKVGDSVEFPLFTGERIYMREFATGQELPPDLSRWQQTVDMMTANVPSGLTAYLMVDQGVVKAGTTHRRGGMHVDGYWIPAMQAHSTWSGGHTTPSEPSRSSGHSHTPLRRNRDSHYTPRHCHAGIHDYGKEAIILASDLSACRALSGEWFGRIGEGGDCSHINFVGMDEMRLEANQVYAGNALMLHESMPISADSSRTLVRLNVKGWEPCPQQSLSTS